MVNLDTKLVVPESCSGAEYIQEELKMLYYNILESPFEMSESNIDNYNYRINYLESYINSLDNSIIYGEYIEDIIKLKHILSKTRTMKNERNFL
jgi:hypothetical protein